MVNPTYEKLGSTPSMIRELFAYGLRRSAEVGPEHVYDYSLGNPSIPAPQPVLDPTQEMTTVEVEGHDYIGVLSIPAAGLELPVMAQWSYAGLKVAPGRYSGTTYADDLVICGHNYAKHFSPIKWLAIGSPVYFTDADGLRWNYEVESVETLQPTQIEEMTTATETDSWNLTLFTCTSGGNARYAVRCVRTGYPVRVTDAAE